ncbi:MAG: DegV family EDD domain-containing protein [Anaerolineales bacterium]|nr:DegV family EDD domain-containing protein [Anaerolineales bacterium]
MPVAIITDSTVSFPSPVFPGRELVHILSPGWQPALPAGVERLKASDFPPALRGAGETPRLLPPRAADFEALYRQLGPNHDGVLVVLHSNHFSKIEEEAQAASGSVHGKVAVRVVDSLNISLGLGLVVQAAAQASAEGMALAELELYVRGLLPRLFGMLCVPGLSYLERSGQVNHSQAVVGEYLEILQVFTLDNGQLVPTQKARNTRQLVDVMYEFLSEFTQLQHIALLQGSPAFEAETRALRERLAEEGFTTPISEQTINAPLASYVGPHSLGLFTILA